MKLPKSLKIGLYDYEIKELPMNMSGDVYGDASSAEKVIRVTQYYGDVKTVETLVHEVFHAIYHEWYMDEKDDEERLVATFSNAFCVVLQQNPELLALLKKLTQ